MVGAAMRYFTQTDCVQFGMGMRRLNGWLVLIIWHLIAGVRADMTYRRCTFESGN